MSVSCIPSAQLRQLPVGICYRNGWGGGWRKGWRRWRQAVTLAPGAPSRPSRSRLRGSGSGPTPASPALPGTWGLNDHSSRPHLRGSALSSRSPSLAWTLRSPGLSSDPDRSLAMATAAAATCPRTPNQPLGGPSPGTSSPTPGQLSHPTGALPVPSAACWGVHACGDQEGGTALWLQPAEGLPKRVLSLSRLRRRSPGGARLSEPPRGLARYARGARGAGRGRVLEPGRCRARCDTVGDAAHKGAFCRPPTPPRTAPVQPGGPPLPPRQAVRGGQGPRLPGPPPPSRATCPVRAAPRRGLVPPRGNPPPPRAFPAPAQPAVQGSRCAAACWASDPGGPCHTHFLHPRRLCSGIHSCSQGASGPPPPGSVPGCSGEHVSLHPPVWAP